MEKQHESDIKKLQAQVFCRHASKGATFCLDKKSLQSNTTRASAYKKGAEKLAVDSLSRVLAIDPERKTALVEPRVSMYELVRATTKEGFVPLVVPEFKGITVGGAVMGCGGESSSHKHGLFHDICNHLEVLVGDGRILNVSPHEHSDLFYGLAGSYGSLGVLLAAEIQLEKAHPWVALQVHRYLSGAAAIEAMRDFMAKKQPPEYLEGIIFSETDAVIIEGNPADTPVGKIVSDGPISLWYYQFLRNQNDAFSMPLVDYLFRHDRGAFWMGAFVLYPPILKKLLCEGVWKIKPNVPFTEEERFSFAVLRDPSLALRVLSYPFTESQKLFSLWHSCNDWAKDRFMVQDFTLPEHTVTAFLHDLQHIAPMYPLWLCPVRGQKTGALFAPHSLNGQNTINIGVYGIPQNTKPLADCLSQLEDNLKQHGGRKWFYTNSCYTPEQFWQVYDQTEYNNLRSKYNADGVWVSIENKVLNSTP